MNKSVLFLLLVVTVTLIFAGCAKETPEPAAQAVAAPAPAPVVEEKPGVYVENAFPYIHVDGHKHETEKIAFVPFEYELLDRVKYQVVYIACTCRGPEVNYWSAAFCELSKEDGRLLNISWDVDDTGHYTAGLYGDSVVTWEGAPAYDLGYYFAETELVGKSQEYVNALEAMHGDFSYRSTGESFSAEASADDESGASEEETADDSAHASELPEVDPGRAVDDYTGATVTPNNIMRMLQGLFVYHNERYM